MKLLFTNHNEICTISLELQTPDKKPITLRARPPSTGYPNRLPILAVETEMPSYIRLSILKRAEVQEMRWPMNFMVVLLGISQAQSILHCRSVLDALEVVVPAADIRHHVEAHKPAGHNVGSTSHAA